MKTILVMRPELLAASLAKRLKALGYQAFCEPLLTLSPRLTSIPDVPDDAAVVLTSRLSFSVLAARRSAVVGYLNRPCYCVGSRTGAEARAFGFTDVRVGEGDGEALAHLILNQEKEGRSLLHIGGEDIHPDVMERLNSAGRSVVNWVVYKADEVEAVSSGFQEALKTKKLDAALFFSPRSAQIFVKHVQALGLGPCCAGLTAIGLSEAVVAPLAAFSWKRVLVSAHPTEDGVVESLLRFLPVT